MDTRKLVIAVVIVILVIAIGAYAFISINHVDTKIEITANNPSQNGDNITVQLKDSYRNVYPDQQIDLKILDDSGWAYKYSVTTGSDGCAYVPLNAFDNGEYTVHATFNGTMFMSEAKNSVPLVIDDGLGY